MNDEQEMFHCLQKKHLTIAVVGVVDILLFNLCMDLFLFFLTCFTFVFKWKAIRGKMTFALVPGFRLSGANEPMLTHTV